VSMPLFAVIIAVAILGVAAGGMATWFRQRHWRRAARQHEADARRARAEADALRAAAAVSRAEQQRLPAPSGYGFYGAAGRDKQGATL
jgi:Tfp pilus assembly protein FimT